MWRNEKRDVRGAGLPFVKGSVFRIVVETTAGTSHTGRHTCKRPCIALPRPFGERGISQAQKKQAVPSEASTHRPQKEHVHTIIERMRLPSLSAHFSPLQLRSFDLLLLLLFLLRLVPSSSSRLRRIEAPVFSNRRVCVCVSTFLTCSFSFIESVQLFAAFFLLG